MRNENDSLFRFRPDLQQLGLHKFPRLSIERSERFVHEEHDWIRCKCSGKVYALLHAAGKLRRIVTVEARKTDQLNKVIRALLHRGFAKAFLQLHAVANIPGNGPPWQQARMLENHCSVNPWTGYTLAIDRYVALLIRKQTRHNVEHRCLPATAWADDSHELAVVDREGYIGQCEDVPVFPFNPVMFREVIDL